MDVRLPDGTLLRNVPDDMSKADLTAKLQSNGYDIGKLSPSRANVEAETTQVPEWAKENPRLYATALKAREIGGPTVEALGAGLGGILGGTAGAVAGPIGVATGAVGGAGLGYGIAKEGLTAADVALGLRKPRTTEQLVTEPLQNIVEGATYEAGGRVAAPYLAKGVEAVGRGIGKLADIRQIPLQRAANIAKGAVGEADEVINALRAAEPGATPANALAAAGLNEPTAQALLRRAAARDPKFFTDLSRAEDAKTFNALAKIAGGETQTAARTAQAGAKNALNEALIPTLETEIGAANIAGKKLPALEGKAKSFADVAASKVEDVRRMTAAGERAGDMARAQMIERNLPVGAARYTYMGELANKADEVASQSANASLPFGEASRFSQAAADSLASHGLTPLRAEPIMASLDNILANPKFAGADELSTTVQQLKNDIVKWQNAGGVIDAWALDSIRKNSVNAAVRQLSADPKQQKQLAAKVMTEVKPLLIGAIEEAGGTGYGKYLSDYAAGMQKIGQAKLGAKALDFYKTAPNQFIDLVEGNSPEVVDKIFGPGSYDIAKEMSQDAMTALTKAGKQVKVQEEIGKQATAGEQALVDLIKQNLPSFRLPNIFSVAATTTNKALDAIEKKLGRATMDTLTEAAKTAGSFEKLLKVLPAEERIRVLKTLSNAQTWQALPKGTQGAAIIGATEATKNALISDNENQNAL
ncbi:MAG: hypothetical protein ACOYOI_08620, partial [Chthoniobacterales bacterium]